jgi:hypothetical protein
METMDNVLVSLYGGGKLKQDTSNPDLPCAPYLPNNPALAPHQVGGTEQLRKLGNSLETT